MSTKETIRDILEQAANTTNEEYVHGKLERLTQRIMGITKQGWDELLKQQEEWKQERTVLTKRAEAAETRVKTLEATLLNLTTTRAAIANYADYYAATVAQGEAPEAFELQNKVIKQANEGLAQRIRELEQQLAATEAALCLATDATPGKPSVMWLPLERWREVQAQLAAATERADDVEVLAERFGADQWRNGNAGKDPQEFDEWRQEQA